LDNWYRNDVVFHFLLDTLLNHLGITAGALDARMDTWANRDFDIDYQDPIFVRYLNTLRVSLQAAGGLTSSGLVTPHTTPTNSPGRGAGAGGGGNV
jgi:hypothetical protein